MRQKTFLLALLPLLAVCLTSCSSDDSEDVTFAATEIILKPQAEVVKKFGRYQIHTATIDINEPDVSAVWSYSGPDDPEFSTEADNNTFYWWPINKGTYTIKVVLTKSGATKTLTKQCEVEEINSYGFGYPKQPIADIMANETMYALYYFQSTPVVSTSIERLETKSYNVWSFEDERLGIYRRYFFDGDELHTTLFKYIN